MIKLADIDRVEVVSRLVRAPVLAIYLPREGDEVWFELRGRSGANLVQTLAVSS